MKNKINVKLISILIILAGVLFGSNLVGTLRERRQAALLATPAAPPDYIIISRAEFMALPTSGAAWDSVKSRADAAATPNLCDQNNKADVNALAAGIVYARTGDAAYRAKAINLINAAMASQRDGCGNAVLAMGRQLGGYVLAADFAGYRDPVFTSWLAMILDREIGGHSRWHVLRFAAYDTASNWGVHALTSTTVSDIFLNRTSDIEKDWRTFASYGVPYGGNFNKASSYNEQWSCFPTVTSGKLPVAINPGARMIDDVLTPCVRLGVNLDGAPVEDSSRSSFGSFSTYIHESLQGYAVMAQLWNRTGRDGWGVNDRQVCRAAQFGDRAGKLNDSSVSYFVAHMANKFCGLSLPTRTPTAGGRMFGFSDWLFSGAAAPVTPLPVTATFTSVIPPIPPTLTPAPVTVTPSAIPPSVTPSRTPTRTPVPPSAIPPSATPASQNRCVRLVIGTAIAVIEIPCP